MFRSSIVGYHPCPGSSRSSPKRWSHFTNCSRKLSPSYVMRLVTSIPSFQEDHSHTANFESTQARNTSTLVSLSNWRSHHLSPHTRGRESAPYLLHQSHTLWHREALPNDRKGGASTHHLKPMTQALLPESSSGSQDELPHQVGFEKSELAGRMVAWSIELSEFNIQYEPCNTLKFR